MDLKTKEFEAQAGLEVNDSASLTSPPPPYTSSTGPQIFDVDYRVWVSDIYIRSLGGALLFTAHREKASTKVEVRGPDGGLIAASKASSMSTKIHVQIFDRMGSEQAFDIRNHGTFGSPEYTSPSFGGQNMTWRGKAMSKNVHYDLTDESGKVYVKFESDHKTKVGKLEIMEAYIGEECLNEIAGTLLTLLVRKLRNMNDSPQYGLVH